MADPIYHVPLVKEGQFPPGESPPPYNETEMSGGHENQYAYNNQPLGFVPQQRPTFPAPSAPPGVDPAHNPANNITAVNFAMPTSPVVNPAPNSTNTVTAVNFAMPSSAVPVGPKSMQMRCFHCQAFIRTKTDSSCKSSAHVACCVLFFLSCGICSCIPYCMGSCRRIDHSCPNCGSFLGSFNA